MENLRHLFEVFFGTKPFEETCKSLNGQVSKGPMRPSETLVAKFKETISL